MLSFRLRNRYWGKLALRSYLPAPTESQTTTNEREFYSKVIAKSIPSELREQVQLTWDVGCRNWSYANAVARAFPNSELIGVELDGGRRYWNGHRRIDMAEAYAAELALNGTFAQCLFTDFKSLNLKQYLGPQVFTTFCFFFPFVSEHPCKRWGVPKEYANFQALLEHANRGVLLAGARHMVMSCHQGEWEAEIAREAYQQAGLMHVQESILRTSEFSGLWPSPYDVHIFTAL